MRCLSRTLTAAIFGGALGLAGLASAPVMAQDHFHSMGGWHGSTARSGTWRDRDDRFRDRDDRFRDRDDRFRSRDRDDRFGFRDRDDRHFGWRDRDDWRWRGGSRGGVAVGFYGGWPYYGYGYPAYAPYGYGYGGYSYCDPYSDYYDSYYCGY